MSAQPLITGKTGLLGVIGYPIQHSLSPVMHNAALVALQPGGLSDYVYVAFPVKPEELPIAINGFAAIGVQGFNVTIPHKQAILPFLAEISPIAQTVGAVNTVKRTAQGWWGTNTDVQGFLAPLRHLQRDWSQEQVLILGCGGSASAVVVACAHLGCGSVAIVGRDQTKLADFQHRYQHLGLNLAVYGWDQLAHLLPTTTLLINTTPIGLSPQPEQSPLTESEVALLTPGAIVYDLIYTPRPTRLLQLAQARQLVSIDGLEMLIHQGADALEIWIERSPPVEVMRRAALNYLGGDEHRA